MPFEAIQLEIRKAFLNKQCMQAGTDIAPFYFEHPRKGINGIERSCSQDAESHGLAVLERTIETLGIVAPLLP